MTQPFRYLVTVFLMFLAPSLWAVQEAVEMEGATPRKPAVFVVPEIAPWGYRSESGEPAGIVVALVDRMAELADVPVRYQLRPHKRALTELESGSADFATLFRSPRSEAAGIAIAKLFDTRIVLTTLPDQSIMGLEDLAGKSVAYVEGTYYGEPFADKPEAEKVTVKGPKQGLDLVDRGRVAALISFDAILERVIYASGHEASDFRSHAISEGMDGTLFISRKSDLTDYIPLFQKAIEQMKANGEIVDLIRSAP
ncbi:MAG: transporter substrate-binding domain-containing protein [Marinobacter sp.]|uniref:substrate-binding periplasmic protein n=1 Tax=Marinobacter sp. TaxID=50741 RepID=UPI00299E999D|nr:transporter substrate-binding domain-containing protein [Marinobacter sp.]MDX1634997.1 transporter substrate-binding domain-containing protein [Marinobacter sp.]